MRAGEPFLDVGQELQVLELLALLVQKYKY
jgi:hypothetical protein